MLFNFHTSGIKSFLQAAISTLQETQYADVGFHYFVSNEIITDLISTVSRLFTTDERFSVTHTISSAFRFRLTY